MKLLEAFSMACPVITTTVGALGFPVRHGEEALIADPPEEFRAALKQLDRIRAIEAGPRGKSGAMILRDFDWRVIGPRMRPGRAT